MVEAWSIGATETCRQAAFTRTCPAPPTEAKHAGLYTVPGTAAEILDDDVRWIRTKLKLPAAAWIEIVSTAHRLGIRSGSTTMYGHVDNSSHWVSHLRTLSRIQDDTGGFTEFVLLPFHPHQFSGLPGQGGPARPHSAGKPGGPRSGAFDAARADRPYSGSWVKLGGEGTQLMLGGAADDLGGTLMEETISRMAGADAGPAHPFT